MHHSCPPSETFTFTFIYSSPSTDTLTLYGFLHFFAPSNISSTSFLALILALFSVLLSLFHVLARLLFQNRFSKLCRLLFLLWPLLLLWPYPFHCSAFRSFIFPFGDSLFFAFLYLFSLYSIFLGFIPLNFLFLFFLSLHVFFLHFYTFFIHILSTIYSFALIIVLINILKQ